MKRYEIKFEIKVWLLANGTERKTLTINVSGKNKENAVLQLIKSLDLDVIKFLNKDLEKAFSFEIEEIKSVKLIKD